MATKKKVGLNWVHRIAGIAATFEAEDQGRTLDLEYTIIVGSIPRDEGEEPLHVVYFEGQETDRGEYWWSTDGYLTVTRDAEGTEQIGDATDEQVKQAEPIIPIEDIPLFDETREPIAPPPPPKEYDGPPLWRD